MLPLSAKIRAERAPAGGDVAEKRAADTRPRLLGGIAPRGLIWAVKLLARGMGDPQTEAKSLARSQEAPHELLHVGCLRAQIVRGRARRHIIGLDEQRAPTQALTPKLTDTQDAQELTLVDRTALLGRRES